jgi:hypothetical protein
MEYKVMKERQTNLQAHMISTTYNCHMYELMFCKARELSKAFVVRLVYIYNMNENNKSI